MNAERLLALYEKIAEAPDAITRLRRFILDLAVRGKLVLQHPEDEPASELLRRIAAERSSSKKMATTSKSSAAAVGAPELFDLPSAWHWTDLQSVCTSITDGDHLPPPKAERGIPFLVIGDVRSKVINYSSTRHVAREYYESLDSIRRPRVGDLLYTLVGSFGIPVQVVDDREFCVQRHIGILRPSSGIAATFLARVLESGFAFSQAEACATGIAQKTVPLSGLRRMVLPLPPLAEQERIVAKVDELMALCDQLEKSRTAREETRDRLTAASLARLNDPAPETFQTDARFVLDALPSMTARPDQIRQLRQTILSLAVRGKLTPQNLEDQSASKLLAQVNSTRLVRRRFAELDKAQSKYELPEIPVRWTWTTIDQCSADDENAITDGPFGAQLKTEHYIGAAGFRVIRLQNIGAGNFREEHTAYIERSRFERLKKHHVKPGDLIVAGLVDPRLRCCEVPSNIGPALVKADCYRFSVHPTISSLFVLYYLNSPLAEVFASGHHHGMTLKRLGLGNFRQIPIPLPPLAEQKRIVAKVDELMAICDRLETSLAAGEAAQDGLLNALLHEALEPSVGRLEAAA